MSPALLWFVAGLVLILLELALPVVVLVFFGLAAWVTALALWLGWVNDVASAMILFAVASTVLLFGLRRLLKSWLTGLTVRGDEPADLEEFMGKAVPVIASIPPGGTGKVEFKGSQWNAQSTQALESGEIAIITGREGLCLFVRPK